MIKGKPEIREEFINSKWGKRFKDKEYFVYLYQIAGRDPKEAEKAYDMLYNQGKMDHPTRN